MKITVELEITRCRDCFYVTNSSQMHDCAFTSAPHPTVWYCRKISDKRLTYLEDEYKVDERCPLKSS